MKLVCISGNFTRPSRTRVLLENVAESFARHAGCSAEVFDLLDAGPQLGTATGRDNAGPAHLLMWEAVRGCDALAVASPVYKASYSGLLKHFFDLMEMDILAGKPVLVGATGKAPTHALMLDHQFRPLFAFFRALVVPSSLFALDADFEAPDKLTQTMRAKVDSAVSEIKNLAEALATARSGHQ
ncbi:MAG: NAD(P)H-dependent oxidoreductase [Rhizobiaceae bacterium]|nr:NAD(P)H-dependent oxidoreductase [Rhizobiaceae bacterium]